MIGRMVLRMPRTMLGRGAGHMRILGTCSGTFPGQNSRGCPVQCLGETQEKVRDNVLESAWETGRRMHPRTLGGKTIHRTQNPSTPPDPYLKYRKGSNWQIRKGTQHRTKNPFHTTRHSEQHITNRSKENSIKEAKYKKTTTTNVETNKKVSGREVGCTSEETHVTTLPPSPTRSRTRNSTKPSQENQTKPTKKQ